MRMLCSKFHQNLTINKGGWRIKGAPIHNFFFLIIIGKHMEMLCLKYYQSREIKGEFDFWGVISIYRSSY